MDLSALIFVALAVAWAVYLVPKALKAHEVDSVTRPVDRFSDRLRVLARREAVSTGGAELRVGSTEREADEPEGAEVATKHDTSEKDAAAAVTTPVAAPAAQRDAAKRAARRRRRVLGLILLANVAVVGVAIAGLVAWPYVAIPATLLVVWLVACRVMVRSERAMRARQRDQQSRRAITADPVAEPAAAEGPLAEDAAALDDHDDDTDGWEPVPITLPTYVAKEPAGRTVRTIDLDSTGVWSSGRNEADSRLAREADAARHSDDAAAAERRRAAGS